MLDDETNYDTHAFSLSTNLWELHMNLTATTPLSMSIAAAAKGKQGAKTIRDIAEGRSDEYRVNPFDIEVEDGFNVRDFDSETVAAHIDSLAQSIAQIGVQRALKVRNKGGVLLLKDGECRLRATIRAIEVYGAEIKTVPVKVADRSESDADATLGILVENSGLEVTPMGKAEVVKRLKAFGWSEVDIASKAGLSKARVGQLLDLIGLGEGIKALIRNETVSPTLALEIARQHNFDDVATLKAITTAQTKVAAKGRTRVTKKAVTGEANATSAKSQIASILSALDVEIDTDGEVDVVCATFAVEDWAKLCELLKIENKALEIA